MTNAVYRHSTCSSGGRNETKLFVTILSFLKCISNLKYIT
jgi:hypothetical protein